VGRQCASAGQILILFLPSLTRILRQYFLTQAETPRQRRTLILVFSALALLTFVCLAEEVVHGRTQQFDDYIRLLVHSFANPGLTAMMRGISSVGTPNVLIALSLPTIVWLVRRGRTRTVLVFCLTMAGAEVLDQILKLMFHRARPSPFFGLAEPMGYSFPSGHALVSFAFFGAWVIFAKPWRWWHYIAAAVPVAAIGLSRIYLGVHYPTDVLGGWAAGLVWTASVYLAFSRARAPR
jgi:undecaprenyl-diphosphatase